MMRRQASCVRMVIFLMASDESAARIKLRVQLHRRFHGGLRMKLGRVADLEEHVLHHVGAVRPLEFELLPAERNIVEAPGLRGQRGGVAHLAGARHQRQPHGAAGRVARGPAFARAGVGRVAIGAQALPIDPCERERVDGLLAREAEQLADDGGRSHLDQHHVIEADLVERVFKRDAALNLVRLDHGRQNVAHGQRRSAFASAVRESQSAVARIPPRLSEGCPHSAASQVSLKSSQRIMAPILNAACTGSS